MVLKYNCNLCNYHTNHNGNYQKHINTKKHKKYSKNGTINSKNGTTYSKNGITNSKNGTKKFNCKYCFKNYSTKTNLKKHHKKCKIKEKDEIQKNINKQIQKIIDEKNKLEKKYKKNKKKLIELTEDYDEIKIENEELEKEYNDFLKKTANNLLNKHNSTKNITNMYYVINNFTNAPNFQDQITEQLTDSEKNDIIKSGPVTGCVKLINMKCIKDKEINKRSIHCLDSSRRKFMVRVDNNWQIDLKGKKILILRILMIHILNLI